MISEYLILKFVHILIAIIALGTSAGLGIMLEFYGNHPTHGLFVLRAIRRLVLVIVIPGYLLMLVTGTWLTSLAWSFSITWILTALCLWLLAAVFLSMSVVAIGKQITLFETEGQATRAYQQAALLARITGGIGGLLIVGILYLMVTKPIL